MGSKWMKRSILFKTGFKAFFLENINKKVNIGPEPENKNRIGTHFSNFLLKQVLN